MMSVSPPGHSGPTGNRTQISGTPGRRLSRWTIGPDQQWTAGDSNPDPRPATAVSFRWTSSPLWRRPGRVVVSRSETIPAAERAGHVLGLLTHLMSKVRPGLEPGLPPY